MTIYRKCNKSRSFYIYVPFFIFYFQKFRLVFAEYDWLEYQYFPVSLCTELQIWYFLSRRVLVYGLCCNILRMSLTVSWDKLALEIGHKVSGLGGFLLGVFWGFFLCLFLWFISESIMHFFQILKTTGDTGEQQRSLWSGEYGTTFNTVGIPWNKINSIFSDFFFKKGLS